MNDELAAVRNAINGLHQLMVTLSDPADVQVVGTCLSALTKIQTKMSTQQQPNPVVAALGR